MAPPAKSTIPRSMTFGKYVALLRGINVGGKNKLLMRDLAVVFAEAGCTEVQTYIQSGNVVFGAAPATVKRLAALITQGISERFGHRVPVVLRTANEIRDVVAGNPYLKSGADVASLHVVFLAEVPDRNRAAALDPNRSPGDSLMLRGREIYLCLPNGVADSKLTNQYFDSTLATISTGRNWRTVLKLLAMTGTID